MNSKHIHYNDSHDTRSDLRPRRVCNGPASTLPAYTRHLDQSGFAVTPTVHDVESKREQNMREVRRGTLWLRQKPVRPVN